MTQHRRLVLLPWEAGQSFDGEVNRTQARRVLDQVRSGAHGVRNWGVATLSKKQLCEVCELESSPIVLHMARQAGVARDCDVWMVGW